MVSLWRVLRHREGRHGDSVRGCAAAGFDRQMPRSGGHGRYRCNLRPRHVGADQHQAPGS